MSNLCAKFLSSPVKKDHFHLIKGAYRYAKIARYLSKVADFNLFGTPPAFDATVGVILFEFRQDH